MDHAEDGNMHILGAANSQDATFPTMLCRGFPHPYGSGIASPRDAATKGIAHWSCGSFSFVWGYHVVTVCHPILNKINQLYPIN